LENRKLEFPTCFFVFSKIACENAISILWNLLSKDFVGNKPGIPQLRLAVLFHLGLGHSRHMEAFKEEKK